MSPVPNTPAPSYPSRLASTADSAAKSDRSVDFASVLLKTDAWGSPIDLNEIDGKTGLPHWVQVIGTNPVSHSMHQPSSTQTPSPPPRQERDFLNSHVLPNRI